MTAREGPWPSRHVWDRDHSSVGDDFRDWIFYPRRPRVRGNRVEFMRRPVPGWYDRDTRGVERGFTVLSPPA